jgi:hypothetical protein
MRVLFLLLASLSALLFAVRASLPTHEEYEVYSELKKQLFATTDGPFNLYTLAEVFYPKVGPPPICVPISYTLTCPNASVITNCTDPIHCTDSESNSFNASFLWSHYDLGSPIGPVLLSYAWNGITLRGFDWEDTCSFQEGLHFVLDITNVSCRSGEVVNQSLQALTAVMKSYAKKRGKERALGDSDTSGYALKWNDEDKAQINASHYTLVSMIVILNLFVFLIVTVMTAFTYDSVYRSIIKKKNPYYPLFWSFVFLSFLWNVGPSWLVLTRRSMQVYYSLAVMIPLEGLVAILIKKKCDFPIPLLPPRLCPLHMGYNFSFDRAVIDRPLCLISHVVQTLAIWTILVFLTFVAYYISSIIVAFYLYPTQVLIKVVFLKAVAVCAVLNVALLFSNSKFECKCSWESFKQDLSYTVRLLTIVTFLPILGFLAFVIGGILFTRSGQVSGLQSVLTLLPSLFLVFAAWFTKGTLFPVGTDEADLDTDIVNELERGGARHTQHTATKSTTTSDKSSTPTHAKSGELVYYNSLDSHLHTRDVDGRWDGSENTDEHTPLLK